MKGGQKILIENEVEKYFVDQVKKVGALVFKFTSPGTSGVPDRIVCYFGKAYFVELKRPGGKQRPLQKIIQNRLLKQKMDCSVISTKKEVDEFCLRLIFEKQQREAIT